MTRHSKEMVQYSTASVSLLSGIILTFLSFFLNEHKIPNEVLWYVSQTLVYAGSVFGITTYINTKFGEIKSILNSNGDTNDTQLDKAKSQNHL